MYRGMHFATDVAFGALGGLLWLLVVLGVLWPRGDDLRDPARRPAQEVAAP
jgi:membrane-associated phospholipid phosphatase